VNKKTEEREKRDHGRMKTLAISRLIWSHRLFL